MRKIYSLILLMLLPLLAVAQDNLAITSSYNSSSYYDSKVEKRLVVPFAAAGIQQEAMSSSDAGANFSVGMWLKTTAVKESTPDAAILFRMGTPSHANNNGALQLLQTSAGALTLKSGGDNIGTTGVEASMGTATLNEWHHILISFDSANNTAAVYVDGEQTGTSDAFGKFGYKWDDGVFQFVNICWSGSFDELQFFNTALDADQAKVASINARAVSSLTTLYTFDAVKSGSTSVFESIAGSVSGSDATWQSATYDNYWDGGLVTDNGPSTTETSPELSEGREILPSDVSVYVMDGEGGTLTVTDGTNTYDAADDPYTLTTGTELTFTATPEDGYKLIGIYATNTSGDILAEIANGGTYTLTQDVIFTARYTNEVYTLTVTNDLNVPYTLTYGGQEVTDLTQIMGGGAQYSLTLSVPETMILESVQLGDETLTAVDGVYTIILDADATLTINARNKAQYTVTITQPEGGTISVAKGSTTINSGDKVNEGDVLTLSNTKDSGYQFLNYIVNGTKTTSTSYTVNADVEISGEFEEGIDYCEPVSQRSGNPTTTSRTDRYLTTVTLTDGTNSVAVSGNGSTSGRNVYVDRTSSVLQSEQGRSLSITSVGVGIWMNTFVYIDWNRDGFDSADKVYDNYTGNSNSYSLSGVSCGTVPEDAAGGLYRVRYIVDWENTDPCKIDEGQSSDNGCAVLDFLIQLPNATLDTPRTVTVATENDAYGSVAITNPATEGNTVSSDLKVVTVKATPATGMSFLNWTNSANEVVSTDATYNYAGTTDETLTAHFGYAVNFTVGSDGTATIVANGTGLSSGDVVAPGTEVTITVTPGTGKNAVVELNGTAETFEGNTFTFTVEEATTIAITFVDQINHITIVTEGNGSVQVWTGYDLDNPNKPAGVQLTNGGVIPAYSESLADNMRALECFMIPGTTSDGFESISSITYTIGGGAPVVVDPNGDGIITMDTSFEIPSDFNEATIATEILLADISGDLIFNVTFTGSTQGIGEIGIDEANGPVEFYNLQGVRVAAENLVPGFYIVRQGNTAKKVFIQK